ncbi:hypothetical protein [Caedibacter taeniospiralis]|uniref:Uncharacterized protein n=1 Tax=Caedibacter taeniospiralis TaxID=28907 RepID=Q6TFD3_CAETA|nr:hypothetical protein [Caedibacter taeniospiralis]AAR87126.1 hypothetical protein [Caedibacter taeniospiralis]
MEWSINGKRKYIMRDGIYFVIVSRPVHINCGFLGFFRIPGIFDAKHQFFAMAYCLNNVFKIFEGTARGRHLNPAFEEEHDFNGAEVISWIFDPGQVVYRYVFNTSQSPEFLKQLGNYDGRYHNCATAVELCVLASPLSPVIKNLLLTDDFINASYGYGKGRATETWRNERYEHRVVIKPEFKDGFKGEISRDGKFKKNPDGIDIPIYNYIKPEEYRLTDPRSGINAETTNQTPFVIRYGSSLS